MTLQQCNQPMANQYCSCCQRLTDICFCAGKHNIFSCWDKLSRGEQQMCYQTLLQSSKKCHSLMTCATCHMTQKCRASTTRSAVCCIPAVLAADVDKDMPHRYTCSLYRRSKCAQVCASQACMQHEVASEYTEVPAVTPAQ